MYVNDKHESVIPYERGAALWRFMDLSKFLSLIQNKCLFFTRVDRLGDPLEGRYTQVNVAAAALAPESMLMPAMLDAAEHLRTLFFASCWYLSESESAGMWRSYPGLDAGIAIKSNSDRLEQSFALEKRPIRISKVKYVDRRREAIDPNNAFNLVLAKGAYYSYENEVRAFHWHIERDEGDPEAGPAPDFGINIKLTLKL